MKNIRPRFAYGKKRKKKVVVLTGPKFEKIVDKLEDYQDYKALKKWDSSKKGKTFTAEEMLSRVLGKK